MTIGVAELQKNISLVRNLRETLYVIDKKTNEVLATILPNKTQPDTDIVNELGGVFSDTPLPPKYRGDLDAAIAEAYQEEMADRHGEAR